MKRLIAYLVAMTAASAAAPFAYGQVLEIGLDGTTTVISGPSVYTETGVNLIQQTAPAARPALPPAAAVGDAISQSAARHAVSSDLLTAVAWQESRFRQDAVSPKGASGVMQLMPATARALGVDPTDLTQNVDGGAAYLRQMLARYDGDLRLALAAYNAGPGAVDRYGGVPPYAETRAYVESILGRLAVQAEAAVVATTPSLNYAETVVNLGH